MFGRSRPFPEGEQGASISYLGNNLNGFDLNGLASSVTLPKVRILKFTPKKAVIFDSFNIPNGVEWNRIGRLDSCGFASLTFPIRELSLISHAEIFQYI